MFQKLREAALAYHLTRKWSKEQILRNYLNTIYFGNGAYGIEAAARTYFQPNHPGCDERGRPQLRVPARAPRGGAAGRHGRLAERLRPDRQPGGRARAARPRAALHARAGLPHARAVPRTRSQSRCPTRGDLQPPERGHRRTPTSRPGSSSRSSTSSAAARRARARRSRAACEIRTTIDSELQDAAEQAVDAWLPNRDGPRAALVAIDNGTGEVRAMVGGDDYNELPFNLATQGQRQPGSAIKPFILAEALRQGISPNSTWASKKMSFDVPKSKEVFTVNNYEDAYSGITHARARDDVLRQLGLRRRSASRSARARSRGSPSAWASARNVSTNYAMTLGGLKQGVTPLDMAHAYETFASGGELVYGTLSPGADNPRDGRAPGPVGIRRIEHPRAATASGSRSRSPNGERAVNRAQDAATCSSRTSPSRSSRCCRTSSRSAPARARRSATLPIAGKTGTTEGYGDAWFVGWTPEYTIAVWVGYPNEFKPMETEFHGEPVAGGTFPAGIFKTFVESILRISTRPRRTRTSRDADRRRRRAARPDRAPERPGAPRRDRRRPRTRRPPPRAGAPAPRRRSRRRRPTEAATGRCRRPPTEEPPPDAAGGETARRPRRIGVGPPASSSTPPRAVDAGQGRDTLRFPATQNRHGSSAALVIPIRVPGHDARPPPTPAAAPR